MKEKQNLLFITYRLKTCLCIAIQILKKYFNGLDSRLHGNDSIYKISPRPIFGKESRSIGINPLLIEGMIMPQTSSHSVLPLQFVL